MRSPSLGKPIVTVTSRECFTRRLIWWWNASRMFQYIPSMKPYLGYGRMAKLCSKQTLKRANTIVSMYPEVISSLSTKQYIIYIHIDITIHISVGCTYTCWYLSWKVFSGSELFLCMVWGAKHACMMTPCLTCVWTYCLYRCSTFYHSILYIVSVQR